MGRNHVYKRRYTVEFRGISTNDFIPRFLDKAFNSLIRYLDGRFRQLNITSYIIEDLRTGGASNLTKGGVQVNLFYKSYGGASEKNPTEGS